MHGVISSQLHAYPSASPRFGWWIFGRKNKDKATESPKPQSPVPTNITNEDLAIELLNKLLSSLEKYEITSKRIVSIRKKEDDWSMSMYRLSGDIVLTPKASTLVSKDMGTVQSISYHKRRTWDPQITIQLKEDLVPERSGTDAGYTFRQGETIVIEAPKQTLRSSSSYDRSFYNITTNDRIYKPLELKFMALSEKLIEMHEQQQQRELTAQAAEVKAKERIQSKVDKIKF
jgi:hypothetical protein